MSSNVALIVGVTGIVGNTLVHTLQRPDASGGPWKVVGIARRPKPEWFHHSDGDPVDYIQCDLLDKSEASSKLSHLTQVTHIFWVTWAGQESEEENCRANALMLNTALDVLLPVARRLKHICLQTGAKHYLGSHFHFRTFGQRNDVPFEEEMPRLPGLNFYYVLEDIVDHRCNLNPGITWSVHRPNIIFGFSPRGVANILGSLALYATICKHERLSFEFPGDSRAWGSLTNFSDAGLIAEQELWAATHPEGRNQAFNVDNGDCTTWKKLWGVLVREFNFKPQEYSGKPTNLAELMAGKAETWRGIVREQGLLETQITPETWWGVDLCLNFPFQLLSSMNKSKEAGFLGFRNTVRSTRHWIRVMKEKRFIPGDDFWAS